MAHRNIGHLHSPRSSFVFLTVCLCNFMSGFTGTGRKKIPTGEVEETGHMRQGRWDRSDQ